jgi:3-hydroxymyristoyl/3-hydroxydecanoyl-(acyl carrier protein) dehydratase
VSDGQETWPGPVPSFGDGGPGAVTIAASRELRFAAPLVAVDEVTAVPAGGELRLRATKLINANDPYMPAHFPSLTVFPGVFIIEAVRQAVVLAMGGAQPPMGSAEPAATEIRQVRSARFLAPIFAGDSMTLEAAVVRDDGGSRLHVHARCWRGDGVAAAQVRLDMAPPDAPDA